MSKNFLEKFISSATRESDPFSGIDLNYTSSVETQQQHHSIDPKQAVINASQVCLASLSWIFATNLTAAISEGGVKAGIKRITPSAVYSGLPAMLFYNATATEAGIWAANGVRDNEEGGSVNLALSVASGAITEAVVGNPADFMSLYPLFTSIKLTEYLKQNPQALNAFSLEDLRKLMPKASPQTTVEQLREQAISSKFTAVDFSTKNIAMMSERTGVKLTLADSAKAVSAMFAPSILRNSAFYYLLLKSNETGEKKPSIEEIATEGAITSTLTSIPNNATYDTATKVIQGKSSLEALKSAVIENTVKITENPSRFAILAGIRFLATMTAVTIFSDTAKDKLGEVIDGISNAVSAALGIEVKKLTQKEQKEADKYIASSLNNPEDKILSTKILEEIFKNEVKSPETSPQKQDAKQLAKPKTHEK